jgi:hypothetical protein
MKGEKITSGQQREKMDIDNGSALLGADAQIKMKSRLKLSHYADFENPPLQEGMIFYGWETAKYKLDS